MPRYIDIENKKVVSSVFNFNTSLLKDLSKLFITYDSEFEQKIKMSVEAIGLYLPQINDKYALVYLKEELSEDFNPITYPLRDLGVKADFISEEDLDNLTGTIYEIFEELKEEIPLKQIRKVYKKALSNGLFDEILKEYNLERTNLELKKCGQDYELLINLSGLELNLEAFFADVDLGKLIGKKYQDILLEADLEGRRFITSTSKKIEYNPLWINGNLYELNLVLRDAMNRIPTLKKSLDNQCKIFGVKIGKLDIKTSEVAKTMALTSTEEIMANISLLKKYDPHLFCLYSGIDPVATRKVSEKQIEYINHIRKKFDLDILEDIKDTTGSNVSNFIKDLIYKHFLKDISEKDKNLSKKISLSHINNLQSLEYNNYGVQPLRTVGGLLFSRVQRYPIVKGLMGDLDEKSCYATALCYLNLYLGQPVITTFKNKKYKPTLKESIDFISNNCPRDGWFIRVSGELFEAINTLILSDLDFSPKRLKIKTKWDINPGRKSIGLFNAFKTSNPLAASTLLTKEIKFGLINAALWDCIQLLPDEWIKEYESLLVDCLVFIPNELICHSLEELEEKAINYPDEEEVEKFNFQTGLKEISLQYCKKNLCLSFPIGDNYKKLRAIRNKLKKEDNPIQEVYKLFLNSGYGALACIYLNVNNLLAANQITACARATSWLMINFLNGCQVITDGATFSWNHIALGQNFKEILKNNPNYLIDFDPKLKNHAFNYENANQEWIDKHFKSEMATFYDVPESYTPIAKFDFELKDEEFIDKLGNTVKSVIYTDLYNTGSGNYVKGLNDNHVLIDGNDYDFYDFKKVKARSFKGQNPELLNWYLESLRDGYKRPYIYSESKIIKFGEGNKLAIKYLESDPQIEEICHPMGFTRITYKLMKLITRSQFLFKTHKQLLNFETINYYKKLDCLSKSRFTPKFWKNLKLENVSSFGVKEIKPNIDYCEYAKKHPIGIGFELLALNTINNGSIRNVRNLIADKISENKTNFNAALNLDRNLSLANKFKTQFAAIIILKANAEYDLKQVLINSKDEPTILIVDQDNIRRLEEILSYPED